MFLLELRFNELVLREYHLENGDRLTIGRHPDNDIVPKDTAVSNHHAIIESEGDKLIVFDKETTNGTFVNGIKVQSAELKNEDVIEIGNDLSLQVWAFSVEIRELTMTQEHDDKSVVFSTIERTLDKL